MKKLTIATLGIFSLIAYGEGDNPNRTREYFYDGYKSYATQGELTVRTTVGDEEVLATGTTASGVRAYMRNAANQIVMPPPVPKAGVVVMSDAHLDAKLFIDWVEKGKPANHKFVTSYEGQRFRKFMEEIPQQISQRKAAGSSLANMDVVWGGDPFDRKVFESLDVEQQKKAFRFFARELKGMEQVDGVKYNFIASLGDHEAAKVAGAWDNKTAWKAAKVNGGTTTGSRFSNLRDGYMNEIIDQIVADKKAAGAALSDAEIRDLTQKLKDPNFEGVKGARSPEYQKAAKQAQAEYRRLQNLPDDDVLKAWNSANPGKTVTSISDISPEDVKKIRDRARRPPQIDIPKMKLGNLGQLDALPESVVSKLKQKKLAIVVNGESVKTSLYDIMKKEIALGGVLDANNNALHRQLMAEIGGIHGTLDDYALLSDKKVLMALGEIEPAAFNALDEAAQKDLVKTLGREHADRIRNYKVNGVEDAKKMSGFFETKARPIGAAESDFLKRQGMKPPARARQLNGIDDQLQISKYSEELGDVFKQEGIRVDRSTFSPYEATVQTGADGRQYAHRHVQYGNLDSALLERSQMDDIIKHNKRKPASRVKYPEMRINLSPQQVEKIEQVTGKKPQQLMGKYELNDDILKQIELKANAGSGDDVAKSLLSASPDGDGLLKGQHKIMMSSTTADDMRRANLAIPGRTDIVENGIQQTIGQHLQGDDGRLVQNHSKTVGGRSSQADNLRTSRMDSGAAIYTSDTHNPSVNGAAAIDDPDLIRQMDQICPGCVGTRPEINSGSMSAKAKNPGRPNTVAVDFGDGPQHLAILEDADGKMTGVGDFDAVPKEQREWIKGLKEAQEQGDDAFVKYLMDNKTGRDPLTGKSMLGDDAVDALRNILPCK